MRLIEPEFEFMSAAKRPVDVVLAGRVRLQARAMPNGVGRVVAGDDVRRVVRQRLCAAVQVRREQDGVVSESGVDEEVLAENRVPQSLVDIEDVFFVARGVLHERRRGRLQKPIGFAVALPRVEAGQLVVVVQLIGNVQQS